MPEIQNKIKFIKNKIKINSHFPTLTLKCCDFNFLEKEKLDSVDYFGSVP